MNDQSNHGRRSRRFGRRHRHRDISSEETANIVNISASATVDSQVQSGTSLFGSEDRRHHRHHRHHRHQRHSRHPALSRLFAQRFRTVASNSLNQLYDGLLNQFPPEMSSNYHDLFNRPEGNSGIETGREMHEFIDERGPPPPYNPYAPPPRSSSNTVSDFLQDPLQTFSKVTQIVQNRTPILNMGIAGAQALHNALTARPPGSAERIYPELPINPDHSGPSVIANDEPPAPPPPLPTIDNTIQANRMDPLTVEEFESKTWTLDELMIRVFKGGITEDNEFRTRLWPFILELTNSTPESDISKTEFDWSEKMKLFEHYQTQWKSILPEQEKRFSLFRERKSLIERDVIRCDRTHPYYSGNNNENLQKLKELLMNYMMYDFDTGYVQGMTDLASPLIYITNGSVEKSFWFFVSVMNFTHCNFEMSQNIIKLQLDMLWKMIQFSDPDFADYLEKNGSTNCYFAFRWIVCQFKREFMKDNDGYNDIVLLWESIWTCSAMKRHLLKLKQENELALQKEEELRRKKISDAIEGEHFSKQGEEQSKILVEPDSPIIDLNSVSMKELQEKDISKEMSQVRVSTSSPENVTESVPETSNKNKECSTASKVNKSRSEPLLNYTYSQRKRLSDNELYVLCICLCIIRRERDLIMARKYDAPEILKHFNTLELNTHLRDILIHAANIWSWMIYDDKAERLYAELQQPQSSSSDSNLANSSSNLNADDEYDLLPDVLSGEDGFLN